MGLDGGRAPCACKIPPAFPYTGLRAGMWDLRMVRRVGDIAAAIDAAAS